MPRHDQTVALVTGAGHGIGLAIASQLAREGAAVAVLEINAARGRETLEVLQAEGARAIFVEADIADPAQVETAFAAAAGALGPINLLVNNAAFTTVGTLKAMTLPAWHNEISVNLNGTYHCIRAMVPRMQAQGGGAIINIASVNGLRYFGNPAFAAL